MNPKNWKDDLPGQLTALAFMAVVASVALLLLSGCNTVGGVGRDLEAAGEEISEAAGS